MIIAETERLRLRQFHIVDGEAMDRVFGDAEVMRYGRGPQTPEWVRTWLRGCLENYHAKWGFGLWAVVERESQQTIGYCGLSRFDDIAGQPETEIGFRLARDKWGCGYATEAAAAVREYAFNSLGLSRLIAIIDPRNVASIRVAEKTGLRFEKDATFKEVAVSIYSLRRSAESAS
ncbi:GNAT family N-acetyltransferase [Anatilimnocola floriformis]|uniref:GNAT family N-acetyltransferase n=1 Tax=Anatilimnocola floriformis TaxID=2948575 RepID=UPI0020C5047B|nr:GNAT family N-acetyltransferase [Anatilimnocola floriformis]